MSRISWINVALGLWMPVAAFFFSHATGAAVIEDFIAGLFVALAALWAACAYRPAIRVVASWSVALSGLWVAAAPFALGYERESVAVANDVVVGLTILALGTANVVARGRRVNAQASGAWRGRP
ncbi:MAG TPA: SPW repeat protein [Gemmatimonadales bacterium]|jgi:hypothetical protein|nr:SPW repeat protein [Gemmatimonadales bacterium]